MTCPNCGADTLEQAVPPERIEQETRLRERFVFDRVEQAPSPGQLKDLTDFAHGSVAAVKACPICGILRRDERDANYASDEYDPAAIDALLPRYVEAFRKKEVPYRRLLGPGAKVLEIGSHFGAFLKVAQEWGWDPLGVDIGKDTSRYANQKGLRVINQPFEECGFADRSFDGVFIWNCFEQLPDPHPTLREAERILKPGGLLLVRTPNGRFYQLLGPALSDARSEAARFATQAMGYNNLLGFPYLYGYSRDSLRDLVSRHGFNYTGSVNSELLTLPLPERPEWVDREEREVSEKIAALCSQSEAPGGPWIELYFNKTGT